MNGKKLFAAFFTLAFLFGAALLRPDAVQAANPTEANLQANRTYSSYDITGDRKNDKIKIKSNPGSHSVSVVVNGKTVYSAHPKYFEDVTAKLYTLKNGKPFLYLFAWDITDSSDVNGVFQYKSGKLKQVINFNTFFAKYGNHQSGQILGVDGNTLHTRFFLMSWSTGVSNINVDYKYKSGSLKRTSNTFIYEGLHTLDGNASTFKAGKVIKAYTSVKSVKKAFTIPKNARVAVTKCYNNGKTMMIQVKYKGKYGWIKPQTVYANQSSRQFANAFYAG